MSLPIYKVSFKDFRSRVNELQQPVDSNNEILLARVHWYETALSIWLYFDRYYTQIDKLAIAESKEFEDVNTFKLNYLSGAIELVELPIEFKRIEFLMEHYHYSHIHLGEIPASENAIALNPEKEQIIEVEDNGNLQG